MQTLGSAPGGDKVYSVSEITACIKTSIEDEFPHVWVVGEISNCTLHTSGHAYFTLKDDLAQVSCVFFKTARLGALVPEEGLRVIAQGRISVYERRGQYQLVVNTLLAAGRGELYAAFNELKARLEKEGLFDASRKRALPKFPSRIGLITSPTGAAVRDFIRIARKVYAGVEILVRPVKVQGEGAAEEIVAALADLNRFGEVDCVVLARGGGSIEDLWAFNEEIVARAISASALPVVSAVGHEIDFTIADFVADVRAATPSAASTIVLADYVDVRTRLDALARRAVKEMRSRIDADLDFIESLGSRYGLRRITDRILSAARDVDEAVGSAQRSIKNAIESRKAALGAVAGKFEALNPLSTLARGYAVCYKGMTAERVTSYNQVSPGDKVRVLFAKGRAICEVERSEKETG